MGGDERHIASLKEGLKIRQGKAGSCSLTYLDVLLREDGRTRPEGTGRQR